MDANPNYVLIITGTVVLAVTGIAIASYIAYARTRELALQRKADAKRQEDEERFRGIFEQAAVGIAHVALDGTFIHLNQRFCDITHYSQAELMNMTFQQITHPDDLEADLANVTQLLDGDIQTFSMEKRYIWPAGDIVWVKLTVSLVRSETKEPEYFIAVIEDIAERKQGEEEIIRLTQFQQGIIENADVWLNVLDDQGNVLVWNKAAEKISGYSKEEVLGHNKIWGWSYPDEKYRKEIFGRYKEILSKGDVVESYETQIRCKNGENKIISWNSRNLLDGEGNPVGSIALGTDITERKRAEEELSRLHTEQKTILDNVPAAIWYKDLENNIVRVNKAGAESIGLIMEEMEGKSVSEIFPDDADRYYEDDLEVIKSGKPKLGIIERLQTPSGERRWVRTDKVPYRNEQGDIAGIIAFVEDITDRKQAEDEIKASHEKLRNLSAHLQAAREEERKGIAREIHDELGQELTALKMDLTWLKGKLRKDQKPISSKVDVMTRLTNTMIRTIKRLTSKLRPPVLDDLGVVPAIEWEADEFQKRYGIECELVFEPEDFDLDPDLSTAVYRIVQETLTNVARHARASKVVGNFQVVSDSLKIVIRDNGIGITKQKAMDPNSFGILGMHERVEQFGGDISIKGRKGSGTTVTIRLPLKSGSHTDD